jgi:hypothetical protein
VSEPILVYVAGRFSAPDRARVERNIQLATELGIEVAKLGAMPVIPHANTSHPDFESVQPYQFWIAGTLALLRACAVCIMVPGWESSSGARGERDEMLRLGRPVFHSIGELRAWLERQWHPENKRNPEDELCATCNYTWSSHTIVGSEASGCAYKPSGTWPAPPGSEAPTIDEDEDDSHVIGGQG